MSNGESEIARAARSAEIRRRYVGVFVALVAGYCGALGYNSLAVEGKYSPDSIFYVDAAQNLASGRGLSTSMGELQPLVASEVVLPRPLTVWAPFFPMLLAGANALGVPFAAGALLLPILFLFAFLMFMQLLLSRLYDAASAMAAIALLLHFPPLRHVATHAWTETTGLAFFTLALCLLSSPTDDAPPPRWRIGMAGFVSGLTVATRYALLPLIGLGLVFLWRRRPIKEQVPDFVAYIAGAGIVIVPMFGRSLWRTGGIGGARGAVTHTSLGDGLAQMGAALAESARIEGFVARAVLFVFAAGSIAGLLYRLRRKMAGETVFDFFVRNRRYVLLAWPLLYLPFLILSQMRVRVDPTSVRLVVPATVVVFLFLAAGLAKWSGSLRAWLVGFALVAVTFAIAVELPAARATARSGLRPVYDLESRLERSELLLWLSQNVTSNDLLFAEDGLDLPFYVGPVDTVFFRPTVLPQSRVSHELVRRYIDHSEACERYDHIYLTLGRKTGRGDAIADNFGAFTADLLMGRLDKYPGYRLVRGLEDGVVFEFTCGTPPATESDGAG